MGATTPPLIADAPWRAGEPTTTTRHAGAWLLRGARILIGDGREIARGHVLVQDGKIRSVGEGDGSAPAGAGVIDATGKVITPGLIDVHSHLGVYASPEVDAHEDGNEATAPVTAETRTIDALWPQDPGLERAARGGVTTIQVLPGSANLVGGRAVTIKLRHATGAEDLRFPGAPPGLKMACGENPKRVYGGRKQAPSTRMGNVARQRAAFLDAQRLIADWDRWRDKERRRQTDDAEARAEYERDTRERAARGAWCAEDPSRAPCAGWKKRWDDHPLQAPEPSLAESPPKRDLAQETLAAALEGRVLVHVHCYRADDMLRILALADEVGLRVRAFHHALEAYKIRAELARRDIAVATWSDWWGFKMEAADGIPENLALLAAAGVRSIVHSDSAEGIQRLNQEAGKGFFTGQQAGVPGDEAKAITWVTTNAAWALGVQDRTGSVEVGKDADLVMWSAPPLSVYARAELVLVDGVVRIDARASTAGSPPWSDFEVKP